MNDLSSIEWQLFQSGKIPLFNGVIYKQTLYEFCLHQLGRDLYELQFVKSSHFDWGHCGEFVEYDEFESRGIDCATIHVGGGGFGGDGFAALTMGNQLTWVLLFDNSNPLMIDSSSAVEVILYTDLGIRFRVPLERPFQMELLASS